MGHTVFIAEDEKVSRILIIDMLKKMGVSTVVASTNGQTAMEKLRVQSGKVDLIISDWNMPVMDGLEFYKTAKDEGFLKNTPFLIVSVEDQKDKIMRAMGAGVNDYIIKPILPKTFQNKVRALLKI